MRQFKHKFSLCLMVSLLLYSHCLFALEQNEKLWTGVNLVQPLSADKKWKYSLFSQLRFINKSHPLQDVLLEAGVGYQLFPDKSIWAGYRWVGHQPYHYFFQTNVFYQQFIWHAIYADTYNLIIRSRLDESNRSNAGQFSLC